MSTFKKKQISLYLILLILGLTQTALSKENELNSLIRKMCILGFNTEMQTAKITPPQGMADFTCNCFLEKVSLGFDLDTAQEECKTKATTEFGFKKK
tara:strand:- start:677 stop:967 length:291 start_codon:yes stop_codon:yes gene_type:complete